MKNQQLVTVSANAPHDIECVVDVAGNGKALLPVTSVEVKAGRLVIACASPATKSKTPVLAATAPAVPPVANSEEEDDDGGEEGGGDEGGGGTMDPPPEPPTPPAAPTAAATVLE